MARAQYFRSSREGLTTPRPTFVEYRVGSMEPATTEDGETYYPGGSMSVMHVPRSYVPTYTNSGVHDSGLSEEYVHHLRNENDDAIFDDRPMPHPELHRMDVVRNSGGSQDAQEEAMRKFKETPAANPETLFVEKAPKTEIMTAFFDQKMTPHAPILGALAHQDFGGTLTADSDLSKYSSRFLQTAQKMGLPVQAHPNNPTGEVTNTYDFVSRGTPQPLMASYSLTPIPESEVKSARQNLKNMIRGKRNHMSPQFEQVEHPKLPGIE